MAEVISDNQLADDLKHLGFSPVEKLILSNQGTVQKFLGLLFETDVHVEVVSQHELFKIIFRWVRLHCEINGIDTTLCLASSMIPIERNTPGMITGIKEQNWGIGQIIDSTGINTRRIIYGIFADETQFARNYLIRDIEKTRTGSELPGG
jgi:hypothetical protein